MIATGTLNISAVIMLLAALVILFGGLTVCITIAVTIDRKKREQGVEFRVEDDGGEE